LSEIILISRVWGDRMAYHCLSNQPLTRHFVCILWTRSFP